MDARAFVAVGIAFALALVFAFAGALAAGLVSGGPAVDDGTTVENRTWERTYGAGPNAGSFYDGVDAGDGYLFVGAFGNETDLNGVDGWVVRTDESGETRWLSSFRGRGRDVITSAVALDDGFVVAGTSGDPGGNVSRWWVARLAPDGRTEWRHTGPPGRVEALAPTPDGGVLAVGGSRVQKLSAGGRVAWTRTDRNASFVGATRLDDGYLLAGSLDEGIPYRTMAVRHIDATGKPVWTATVNTGESARYETVTVSEAIYAAGHGPTGDPEARSARVGKFTRDGDTDGGRVFGDPDVVSGVHDVAPASGGVVTAGWEGDGGRLTHVNADFVVATERSTADTLRSVTALGNGRYLVAGSAGEDAYAAVVRLDTSRTGSDEGGGGGEGESDESGGDATDGEDSDVPAFPAFPVSGLPLESLTIVLVAAAAVAVVAAVGVTVLAWRNL